MDHPNIFEEFSLKVDEVLQYPDNEVILKALRDLAEGKTATLPGRTVLEPLSGLGQQVHENRSDMNYRKAMTALLTWGARSFPIQPSHAKPGLWTSMGILDGPKGYNQRLFTDGQYTEGGIRVEPTEPVEAGLLVPRLPKPTIIIQSEQRPVQPLEENLQYVVDFLKNNNDSRAVVATASRFGWEKLSVDCVCLYVDADSLTNLTTSVASQDALTIIMKAELRHMVNRLEEAERLLEPAGLDQVAISGRRCQLRENLIRRAPRYVGPFRHGQSISLWGAESKGSVSVFLSPDGLGKDGSDALTAYNVVPFESANEFRVITPSGLDVLSSLQDHFDGFDVNVDFSLHGWNQKCGDVKYGDIGTNGSGWRSDWALIRPDGQWRGVNGSWFDATGGMTDLFICTERRNLEFTGSNGIINHVDAMAGAVCYKDGASTGCTVGRIGPSESVMFQKHTQPERGPSASSKIDVDQSKLITFHRLQKGNGAVCAPGDSGCGVFSPVVEKDGWSWVGQLVSLLHVEGGRTIGLMIPQSEILRSLNEKTKIAWRLST